MRLPAFLVVQWAMGLAAVLFDISGMQRIPALISWGCSNRCPQTQWLKTTEISLTGRGTRSQKSRCLQGCGPFGGSRGGHLPLFLTSCHFWQLQESLACDYIPPHASCAFISSCFPQHQGKLHKNPAVGIHELSTIRKITNPLAPSEAPVS